MTPGRVAVLHYSAPPVVGGVEAVILAHTEMLARHGYRVTVIAGRGEAEALPPEVDFVRLPLASSQHPKILEAGQELEQGRVPGEFETLVAQVEADLRPLLAGCRAVIVHNLFTKHFNLPLTVALTRLLEAGELPNGIAWCHDFTWTSPNSRSKVHPGYPWDLLRIFHSGLSYVTVSQSRQEELASLLGVPVERIQIVYNGVDPVNVLGLSPEGWDLAHRLAVPKAELVLLMPVRVTRAKNLEFALQVAAAFKARRVLLKLVVTGPPDPHEAASLEYYQSLLDLRRRLDVEQEARFVYESGPGDEPQYASYRMVGDLLRLSDGVFLPSHREGFGMPVLEAGLAGIPVFSAATIPASQEIGGRDVTQIDPAGSPEEAVRSILESVAENPISRLRWRVRREYTWQGIFENDLRRLVDR